MLQGIIQFSLRFRGIVVALSCLVFAYGIYVASRAKLDVFPDFVPPQVTIQTEAPGLSPEQVEALITRPVETAVNGLGNQESLRSESIQGLSIITVVFKEGTAILPARQLLAEKLGETAGLLPAGVKAPKMSPLTSATMDLLKIGLVSDKLSPMELRTFADWTLKPRLLAVPGVARCIVFGGEVRQLQVQVHPERLLRHNLALNDVLAAARLAGGVRGAGFVETENQRIVVQTEGQSLTPAALAEVVVVTTTNGLPIRLKDVATVAEGAEPKFGDTLVMLQPGVLLAMASQHGANTMEVTVALETALEEMKPVFAASGITLYPRLHRPASFIEASLKNIRHSLLLGAVLVAVVLFLFLGNFRTAFISLTAIPLSLLGAIIVLDRLGVTLNTITLGGLAIAIGEVVDDAIIDVENILRRLRENQTLPVPRPVFRVILDASLEVRTAVVYATFIVALVFLPVLTLTGLQGSFFAPLALSYILAIMVSLAVALTLTPALTYVFFAKGAGKETPPRLQSFLRRIYARVLGGVARHPVPIIGAVVVLCALALIRLPFMGGEFLPTFREGHFVLQVSATPGTSLAEMLRIGRQVSKALLDNPHIATVEQQVGRAEAGEDTWGPNQSEFHIELKRGSGSKAYTDAMSTAIDAISVWTGRARARDDIVGLSSSGMCGSSVQEPTRIARKSLTLVCEGPVTTRSPRRAKKPPESLFSRNMAELRSRPLARAKVVSSISAPAGSSAAPVPPSAPSVPAAMAVMPGAPSRCRARARAYSWLRPPVPLPVSVTVVSPPLSNSTRSPDRRAARASRACSAATSRASPSMPSPSIRTR